MNPTSSSNLLRFVPCKAATAPIGQAQGIQARAPTDRRVDSEHAYNLRNPSEEYEGRAPRPEIVSLVKLPVQSAGEDRDRSTATIVGGVCDQLIVGGGRKVLGFLVTW